MRIALVFALCAGCCVDTYEISADRSNQAIGELTVDGVIVSGELRTVATALGFVTAMLPANADRYALHVPSLINGTHETRIDATRAGELTMLAVTIVTAVDVTEVCMDPDQYDYGTGRCGNSYEGTITISGDVTGTWLLEQLAVVVPGTPDC
jgi:hypothetical protein